MPSQQSMSFWRRKLLLQRRLASVPMKVRSRPTSSAYWKRPHLKWESRKKLCTRWTNCALTSSIRSWQKAECSWSTARSQLSLPRMSRQLASLPSLVSLAKERSRKEDKPWGREPKVVRIDILRRLSFLSFVMIELQLELAWDWNSALIYQWRNLD